MGITRDELFTALGIIKTGPQIDGWTEKAYKVEEEKRWRESDRVNTSFHCSSFPGSDNNCRCEQLYKLMNIPQPEPMSPKGAGIVNVGKCVEEQITDQWNKLGILLNPNYPEQIYIEDEETWLTGYLDAILNLQPDYNYVLPVEIKSKANNKIEYMKVGGQDYDEKHYMQLQAYIQWCIRNHEKMGWDKLGLLPAVGGIIYYVSREDPRNTHEFYVELDQEAIAKGEENLKYWKECYLNDVLPERDKDMRWMKQPCQWNPYKKLCKADYKEGIVKLSESNAVKFALEHKSSYNLEGIRKRVIDRWIYRQLELF